MYICNYYFIEKINKMLEMLRKLFVFFLKKKGGNNFKYVGLLLNIFFKEIFYYN